MMKKQVQDKEKPLSQHDFEGGQCGQMLLQYKIIYYTYVYVVYLITTAMKTFIQDKVEPTLSREHVNIKLDGVACVFSDSLDEMDKLDRDIEKIAVKLVPSNWRPENDALQKERGNCKQNINLTKSTILVLLTQTEKVKGVL